MWGVSRHYIIRVEQALFAEPPPGSCERLGELFKVGPALLYSEYKSYQFNTREIFAKKHNNFDVLYNYKEETHPLVFWREQEKLSQIGLAKGICLHQDSIRNYELNKQRHIAEELEVACEQMNWDLAPLIGAVAAWRIKWR